MHRLLLTSCAANGFLAVLLGAFGAHGLKTQLAQASDATIRLQWWETASSYHLMHALALGVVAAASHINPRRGYAVSGICLQLGILLFCGSLYTMTLTGSRSLGMVTPVGGLLFLVGWLALGLATRTIPSAKPR